MRCANNAVSISTSRTLGTSWTAPVGTGVTLAFGNGDYAIAARTGGGVVLAAAINVAGPVDAVHLSPDRLMACSITQDEASGQTAIKLWNVAQAKLTGAIERDRKEQTALMNSDRELRRTQAAVERSKAGVVEQEKALQAEETAVKTAKTSQEKAAEALAAKEKEMQTATQGIADNEKSIHSVTLNGFYIGKFEVTQAQWRWVMGTSPSDFKNCDDCSVEQVSWNDIQGFLSKINAKTALQDCREVRRAIRLTFNLPI